MTSGIPKGKKKLTDEELKANILERDRKFRKTPKRISYMKKYNQSEKGKASSKKYRSKPEIKLKQKVRNQSDKYKTWKKDHQQKPEIKVKMKEHAQSSEYKKWKKDYNARPETRAKERVRKSTSEYKKKAKVYTQKPDVKAKADAKILFNAMVRLNVLLTYSKRHSNSDVPCCACCGENSYVEFLAIDHILGKKQMDSIPELVAIGYSSKLKSMFLLNWIIENNFPDGFQILCHNCNQSKANTKHNSCIHGNRDQTKFKPDKTASYTLNLRMEVFPHYSKRHSNNDVPCCRCCGEYSNMEFLAIDHILGKKVMDTIPELIELDYSSKMKKTKLLNWIKNNNYLSNLQTEYFQILCHNCNVAKGVYGKCPHERK